MNRNLRIFALTVVILDTAYLAWLAVNATGLGYLLMAAEALVASLTYIFVINHWQQSHLSRHLGSGVGSVDVFIPTVDEPLDMLEATIRAATSIEYSQKRVYLLDDGDREEVRQLATRYEVTYLARGHRQYNKAGNLNYALKHSSGDVVLVIDADHVARPEIVRDILGYFADDLVAVVATRQAFDVPEGDFNHDILFYHQMQPGRNADNAAISCGNGVFYRRAALETIGGFVTWNMVEDLATTYELHRHGRKSVYVNRSYTVGTAPLDLAGIVKQRGTWALDTLRLIFWRSPFTTRGLTLRQRLHYMEIGYSYVVSAIALPVMFILPAISMLADLPLVTDGRTYLIFRTPTLLLTIYFYYVASGRVASQMQFWASLSPVYLKALVLAALGVKTSYRVTSKVQGSFRSELRFVLPHLSVLAFGYGAAAWRIIVVDHALTSIVAINLLWVSLSLYWFASFLCRAFVPAARSEVYIRRALEWSAAGMVGILISFSFLQSLSPRPNEAMAGVRATPVDELNTANNGDTLRRLPTSSSVVLYVNPTSGARWRIASVREADALLRKASVGITDNDLARVSPALTSVYHDVDTDGDGLGDRFEKALGTDSSRIDTDVDGYSDLVEIANGYSPTSASAERVAVTPAVDAGLIYLQVERNGEAWYVNPTDAKRYYLGRPDEALELLASFVQ